MRKFSQPTLGSVILELEKTNETPVVIVLGGELNKTVNAAPGIVEGLQKLGHKAVINTVDIAFIDKVLPRTAIKVTR